MAASQASASRYCSTFTVALCKKSILPSRYTYSFRGTLTVGSDDISVLIDLQKALPYSEPNHVAASQPYAVSYSDPPHGREKGPLLRGPVISPSSAPEHTCAILAVHCCPISARETYALPRPARRPALHRRHALVLLPRPRPRPRRHAAERSGRDPCRLGEDPLVRAADRRARHCNRSD